MRSRDRYNLRFDYFPTERGTTVQLRDIDPKKE
jgi:hypothetical protein